MSSADAIELPILLGSEDADTDLSQYDDLLALGVRRQLHRLGTRHKRHRGLTVEGVNDLELDEFIEAQADPNRRPKTYSWFINARGCAYSTRNFHQGTASKRLSAISPEMHDFMLRAELHLDSDDVTFGIYKISIPEQTVDRYSIHSRIANNITEQLDRITSNIVIYMEQVERQDGTKVIRYGYDEVSIDGRDPEL